MFSFLRSWAKRPPQRPDLHFLVYTRENCHLCAHAWDILTAHQKRRGFTLEKIEVETAPDLVSQYGSCVPVVAVNGQVRFRGQVNEVLLERILEDRR